MRKLTTLILYASVIILISNCKKDNYIKDINDSKKLPVVETSDIIDITQTTAKSGGNITFESSSRITARGVCWSYYQNPTISNYKTIDGGESESFTSQISGLTPNTTYYVRAYATNSFGTSYGDNKYFVTEQDTTEHINCGTITDIDGNTYNTVVIGTQCWMKENLKTGRYRNGEAITTGLINELGGWWSSTEYEYDAQNAWIRDVFYDKVDVGHKFVNKRIGFSVRCIKD